MQDDTTWNIILFGELDVGKTSMIQRYVHEKFSAFPAVTIGCDFERKDTVIKNTRIRLNIWDTVAQMRFSRSMSPQFWRKVDGGILVYDVTDMPTFRSLSRWLSDFRTFNEKAPVIIAGNKNEDPSKKSVAESVVQSYAQREDMEYIECSAKTGGNVHRAFELLIEKVWDFHLESIHLDLEEQTTRFTAIPENE